MTTEKTTPVTPRIVFYCKDCHELVDGIKIGKKYVYRCAKCGTKNVAFGTEKRIRSFYHVQDKPPEVKQEVR